MEDQYVSAIFHSSATKYQKESMFGVVIWGSLPAQVSLGVVPNQYGTWPFGRAGWCPGQHVDWWEVDVTQWSLSRSDRWRVDDVDRLNFDALEMSHSNAVTPKIINHPPKSPSYWVV